MVSLIWVSISLSRVFSKKEERLIWRKSFVLVWEGLPAFGIKITLTSSHIVGMWFIERQPWKMAVSILNVRDKVYSDESISKSFILIHRIIKYLN